MNIQEQLDKSFEATKLGTTQTENSRRITEGSTVTKAPNGMSTTTLGMNTLGMNTIGGYAIGTGSIGSVSLTGTLQFSQPSFGSGSPSGSFTNSKPSIPFERLDPLSQAKIIKDFLISRGVNKINEETARALFLVSCVLKDQVLPTVKQAKKKLII